MSRGFAEIAFTPGVKEQQTRHGSRHLYERAELQPGAADPLGEAEREFIAERDGFYMATVSETGWPYIQYRGGPNGFLRVLDEKTLGFADLRGNRQYISAGNLLHDNRVALFLMDYPQQSRLKILGRAEIHEDNAQAGEWMKKLRLSGEQTPAERAMVIHVEGFDWNCPQHITPRYTQQELAEHLGPTRRRIEGLEKQIESLKQENERLRARQA